MTSIITWIFKLIVTYIIIPIPKLFRCSQFIFIFFKNIWIFFSWSMAKIYYSFSWLSRFPIYYFFCIRILYNSIISISNFWQFIICSEYILSGVFSYLRFFVINVFELFILADTFTIVPFAFSSKPNITSFLFLV